MKNYRRVILIRMALGTIFIVSSQGRAGAGLVLDRPTLDGLLGAQAIREDFEKYSVLNGDSTVLAAPFVDSSTVEQGQGPGLVVGGILLYGDTASLQWNGAGYLGLATRTFSSGDPDLTIGFTNPTREFGVDLEEYSGLANPESITATIYAPDNLTVLDTITGISVAGPSPVFFGYEDQGGIGNVTFTSTVNSFSVVIDNLEFGNVLVTTVPEPPSLPMVALATLIASASVAIRRWRRAA